MNLNEMFPSKYLKADDLSENGDVFTIEEISSVRMKNKNGDDEEKWVVNFESEDKGLVLNKTNAKTLGKLFGGDTEKWIGKKVKLVSQEVEAFGERQMAIRVSLSKVGGAPDKSDDIPF